jgi:peptidyl-tRNA hydrolase
MKPQAFEMPPELQAMLDESARTLAEFTSDHRPLNMYAIIRQDLEMPPGKFGALLAHAFQKSLKVAEKRTPGIQTQYEGSGNGTKLIFGAKNQQQLIRAYQDAKAAGIPCWLVIERGHVLPPSFDGQPIFVALGMGPVYKDEAQVITKRYTLLK